MHRLLGLRVTARLRELEAVNLAAGTDRERFQVRALVNRFGRPAQVGEMGQGGAADPGLQSLLKSLNWQEKADLRAQAAEAGEAKPFVRRSTAGSTGIPLTIAFDRGAVERQQAVRAWCLGRYGIEPGASEARFWKGRSRGGRSRWGDWILNRRRFDFLEQEARQAEQLRRFNPSYIYGYSSLIARAAAYFAQHGNPPPRLKVIVCTAEELLDHQKSLAERAFGVPVIREYGCTEVDLIAWECEAGRYHLVNPWLVLELQDQEIRVTDAGNGAMRITRYGTGDHVAVRALGECTCGSVLPVLPAMEGRTSRRTFELKRGGERHASVIAEAVEAVSERIPEVSGFRAIEEGRGFMRLQVQAAIPTGERAERLRQLCEDELRVRLDGELDLEVEILERLSRPGPGKFEYFVPRNEPGMGGEGR